MIPFAITTKLITISIIIIIFIIIFAIRKKPIELGLVIAIFSLIITLLLSQVPKPEIFPLNEKINSSFVEIIIKGEEKMDIFYSIDGSNPKNGKKYTEPFMLNESATVAARSKYLFSWSSIEKISYILELPEVKNEIIQNINIDDEVLAIRDKYKKTNNNLETYKVVSPNDYTNIYINNDKIAYIKIKTGYHDVNYERWYLLNNEEELMFSFVFFKKEEHRLYFKNDVLFRYIDAKEIYDNKSGVKNCVWETMCKEECIEVINEYYNN